MQAHETHSPSRPLESSAEAGAAFGTAAGTFDRYCAKVRNAPQLTADEEAELLRRWVKKRDVTAARRLIEGNLRLVLILSGRYKGYGVSRDELVAEGNLGLLRALKHFDGRKIRFATYASYWVRSAMLALVMKNYSLVPAGSSARQARMFFRLRSEKAKLEARYGNDREAVNGKLAYLFNASPEEIEAQTARLSGPDASLDAPRSEEDEGSAVVDLVGEERAADEGLIADEQAEAVRSVLQREWESLDARERLIVKERLMSDEEQTLQALGDKVGLTRERMRQLEAKLKTRLKRALLAERIAS